MQIYEIEGGGINKILNLRALKEPYFEAKTKDLKVFK